MSIVYNTLYHMKDKNGEVTISSKVLSEKTGLSNTAIKNSIHQLEKKGLISVKINKLESGANKSNTYIIKELNKESDSYNEVEKVRQIYVAMCKNRDKNVDNTFSGYVNMFRKVVEICKEEKMEINTYIVSCFFTFTDKWCNKTFNQPYPPPYIIASKKNALERYNSFQRYVYQRTNDEEYIEMSDKQKYESDNHFWNSIGSPTDSSILNMLVENGSLSTEFVNEIIKNGTKNDGF